MSILSGEAHWTEAPEKVDAWVRALEQQNRNATLIDEAGLRMYFRRPSDFAQTGAFLFTGVCKAYRRLGHNLTRECVDAGHAMVCREIAVKISPAGADFEIDQSCEAMQKLTDGVKAQNRLISLQQRVILDGFLCRIGLMLVESDPTTFETRLFRLNPLQSFWDEDECENGEEPLSLFYVESVPEVRLRAEYGDKLRGVTDLPKCEPFRVQGVDPPSSGTRGGVRVVRAWSRKVGSKRGLNVTMCGRTELHREEHDDEHLPVAPFRFSWEHRGWAGISAARIIAEYDLENKTLNDSLVRAIQAAVPIVWKHQNTNFEGLTDMEYQVAEWEGTVRPEVTVPDVVSKELLQRMEDNVLKAKAELGINPEIAQGQRPGPNLNSAPSIKAAVDTAQIRLQGIQERVGEFHRDLTRGIIMVEGKVAARAPANDKAPETQLRRQAFAAFKGGVLTERKYTITARLASGLSLTFAGRLAEIEDLKKLAPQTFSDEGQTLRQLQFGDVETTTGRLVSTEEMAEHVVLQALKHGKAVIPPEIPELAKKILRIGQAEYQRALYGETAYPDENVDLLRKVLDATKQSLAPAEVLPPAPPPAPAAPPVAPPMLPPADPLTVAAPPMPMQ